MQDQVCLIIDLIGYLKEIVAHGCLEQLARWISSKILLDRDFDMKAVKKI